MIVVVATVVMTMLSKSVFVNNKLCIKFKESIEKINNRVCI